MAVYPTDYPVLVRVQAQALRVPEKGDKGEEVTAASADAPDGSPRHRDDVAYYCLRPLWLAMQAVGFYPMHRFCRGHKVKEPSPWLALFAVQYAAVLAGMAMSFAAALDQTRREDHQDFDGAIIKYLVYLQCALPIAVLPTHALQRASVAAYLRGWNKLQVDFALQTGRALASCRHFRSRDTAEALVIVVVWVMVAAGCQMALHPPVVVAALAHSNLVSSLLACSWYLHGRLLRAAARAGADHLAEVLSWPSPSPEEVDASRLQLLRLVSLLAGLGSASTLSLGLLLLLHFVLQTLTLYALVGQLSYTASGAARLPSLVAGVVFSGYVLYLCCDTGYRVTRAAKTAAMREIMAFRKRTMLVGADLENMIETYIATAQEVPSDVTLSGITVVNRHLFTAILSTMVTYLVVVVQFRVSLQVREEVGGVGGAGGGGGTAPPSTSASTTAFATATTLEGTF